jgi:UDP-N-acetylmuramoyl-tripeptide--D-alanyl-D-alanine ligase
MRRSRYWVVRGFRSVTARRSFVLSEGPATGSWPLADPYEGIALQEVTAFTGGRDVTGTGELFFPRVSTDSRTVDSGDLFVALRGERFDGHRFVENALERGARGALVEEAPSDEVLRRYDAAVVTVPDCLKALGDLAAGWRRKFPAPVGVLTGSNGKTTTKEMTMAILRLCFSCLWSPGNYNNRIGLPLTLLMLKPEHERVVLEMGMNEPGEIRALTWISQPQAGALLNVGPAHLERFASVEAVAEAKGEMLQAMPKESVFVFNQDDPRVRALAERWEGPKTSFGLGGDAGIRLISAEEHGATQKMRIEVLGDEVATEIHIPGRHNLTNALAAVALSSALGAPLEAIGEGLARFQTMQGRFSVRMYEDFTIVDDSYNANPASMESALETLCEVSGHADRMLVLGDMLELGTFSEEAHRELGRKAGRINPALLCITGDYSKWVEEGAGEQGMPAERIILFEDVKTVAREILARMRGGEWVLIKGSRGMALERVVEELHRQSKPLPANE